jgi:hypothetical protein
MKHLVVALVCAVALGACIHDDIYKPQNPFNLKEVEWATKRGSNSVTGKIDAQGSDGKTYPCTRAGLVPDSAYNRELMIRTTGSTEDGVFFQKDAGFVIMYQDSERSLTERTTDCGWKGHFFLEKIPDGVWFFSAYGGSLKAGYFVRRRLELRGNEKIVINIP